jgi:hypothetical protein
MTVAALFGAAVITLGMNGSSIAKEEAHPAHIHSGTCTILGDVVAPLSNVGGDMMVGGTPVPSEMMGSDAAIPVEVSATTVELSLADITGAEHAINIHESAENIGNYIACGNIGGMVMGGTDLAIGIAPLNDSGYSGAAWLHDNGDGTTTVNVFLMEGGMIHDMGTPDH